MHDDRGDKRHGSDDSTIESPAALSPPHTIGRYVILETLGAGGMGEVYLAEQTEPVRRKVALKIVKLGMDSREVVARFEAERQTLALMNHPGIARIFDGGLTDSGRPYFVMEYVPGISITDYCNRHQLSTGDRLRLLVEVCRAIQHAHQKGIVHRDLKPSNVLVAVQDGKPVPKVIDFGVAKALDHGLATRTVFTARGQLIGTPVYMSPEQVEMTRLDIDTTSDVYSLGVLLYELLTGDPPFSSESLQEAGLAEIQRIIREVDPPRPSLRISGLGAAATPAAQQRRCIPHTWFKEVRGDLDWITMRALEKDRTRRYQSASELAADIERHLGDEPVAAGPPNTWYRVRKFARRHRALAGAAAAIVVTLAVGLAVSWMLYMRADTARRTAEYEAYVAVIRAAQISLDSNDAAAASRFLATCPEALRGWEWRHLDLRADASVVQYTFADSVGGDVRPSRDATRCAVAAQGTGTICIIDLATGEEEARWETGYRDDNLAWAFSPNGERLAAWSAGGEDAEGPTPHIKIWNIPASDLEAELANGAGTDVDACFFNAEGTLLVGCSLGDLTFDSAGVLLAPVLQLWRLPATEPSLAIRDTSAVFASDVDGIGNRIAATSVNGLLSIYDASTGAKLWTDPECPVGDAKFARAGRWLVTGDAEGAISIREVATGMVLRRWAGHPDPITGIDVSRDGRLIASAGGDRRIRIWDGLDGTLICDFEQSTRYSSVMFAPDESSVLSWSNRPDQEPARTVYRWDPMIDDVRVFEGRAGHRLAFGPDGRTLIGGTAGTFIDSRGTSYDSAVRVWEVATGFLRRVLRGHSGAITWCGFDTTGERIYSVAENDSIREWDRTSGACQRAIAIAGVATVDPSGKLAAVRGDDSLVILDLATGNTLTALDHSGKTWGAFAFSPSGREFAAILGRGVRVWRLPEGEELVHEASPGPNIRCLAFSPDCESLALGCWDGSVFICSARTGKILRSGQGKSGPIASIAYDPRGERLAVAGDGVVVWDAVHCRPILELAKELSDAVAFSPGGDQLAVTADDGTVRLWRSTRPAIGATELMDDFLARPVATALVDSLFAEHLLLDLVLDAIAGLHSRDRHVRAAVREIALVRGGIPEDLAEHSRELALPANSSRADYERSRDLARAACWLNPRHPAFAKALGIAQYRLGAFEAARASLARADSLGNPFTAGGGHQETVGFLAMTYAQLGNRDKARAELDRLRRIVQGPALRGDSAAEAIWVESAAVVERAARAAGSK